MILEFLGNCPRQRYFRVGVVGNNLVDSIVMLIDKKQCGDIDLSDFTPYIKMSNKDLTFVDKTSDVEIEKDADGDKIKITYKAPDKVTVQRNIDMQVVFEKIIEDDTLIWQTLMFNITFDLTIDVSTLISDQYPDVLKEINEKINKKATITQYPDKNYFPNIGTANALYLDSANNITYRFDTDHNKYYAVGGDYEDIKIINCNGGQ